MKIGLDASYSIDRQPTGVGVYSSQLIQALAETAPEDELTLCYRANRYLRSFSTGLPARNCRRALLEGPTLGRLANRLDVFHGLNQRLPEKRFSKAVATFHDLFVITSEYSTPDYRERFEALARQTAERADRIIAVSTHTAGQTAELLGYPRERITVAPHGVETPPQFSDDELDAFRESAGLDRPFLLNVGVIQERKNIRRVVQAFETLPADLLLVLAGGEGYGADEINKAIEQSPARDRVRRVGYVESDVKAKLYRMATALAFPSLDEGFGIPLLEAMAAGLPILTSDRSAMPEVAGDAAVLVDPLDVQSIADGLRRVVEDEALRSGLKDRGLARAREFTWKRAAELTLGVYRELA